MENFYLVEFDENNFYLLGIVNVFIICVDVIIFSVWESNYFFEISGIDLVRIWK